MDALTATVTAYSASVKTFAPGLAGLALIIIGLMWMLAKDPQKKETLVGWLINVVIGFVIVYAATSLVTWFGTNTSGYSMIDPIVKSYIG